jgi:hypothetical protein
MLNSAMMDLMPGERMGLAMSRTRASKTVFRTTIDLRQVGLHERATSVGKRSHGMSLRRQDELTSSPGVHDHLGQPDTQEEVRYPIECTLRDETDYLESPKSYQSTRFDSASTSNLSAISSSNPSRLRPAWEAVNSMSPKVTSL